MCPGTRLVTLKLHQPSKSRAAISWSYSTNRPEEMRLVSTLSRIQNQQVGRNLEMQGSQACHLQIQPKIIKIPGPPNNFLLKIPFTKFPHQEILPSRGVSPSLDWDKLIEAKNAEAKWWRFQWQENDPVSGC